MTWFILAVNALMLVLIISAASSAHDTNVANCTTGTTSAFLTQEDCVNFSDAGTGLGVAFVVVLWVMTDMILGLIWLVTNRSKKRDCPACGSSVKRGVTVCPTCSFDFVRAFGAGRQAPTAPA